MARLIGAPERGRFFNLYEAAHAAALAGLKLAGYRSKEGEGSRQLVMQTAFATTSPTPEAMSMCRSRRSSPWARA